jgi:nucleoid DNA-binding protein
MSESKTITRDTIARRLAERSGSTIVSARGTVDLVIDIVGEALSTFKPRIKDGSKVVEPGDALFLSGLGTFRVERRKGRAHFQARTLETNGRRIEIPQGEGNPSFKVVFSAAKDLKEALPLP